MAQAPKKEAAKEAAPEEAAPKGGKKKLIIIIAAVLAIAGGGAGWYFTQAKHGEDGKEKEEKHVEAPKPPEYVPLETFTVNLMPDPDERFLQLDATLQVEGPEVAEHVKAQMPAIRNHMLMLLTSKKASDLSTSEGKAELSQEMLTSLRGLFSTGTGGHSDSHGDDHDDAHGDGHGDAHAKDTTGITSVLFTSFVIQ